MTLVADFNSSVNVPFQRMRALLSESGGGLQEGVIGATDLKAAQRGAGANMSVDVPAGAAWVQIDTGTLNGLGHVFNDATANVTVTASNATNPRIDQIILRWNDSSIPTGSGNVPTLEVLTGTATAGATLDNRTGAAALPNDCLRLADILVPAASTSVTTANIRDRRPWARGVCWFARGSNAGDFTTASTTLSSLATTAFDLRLECSGAPLYIQFSAQVSHSGAGSGVQVTLLQDGVALDNWQTTSATAGAVVPLSVVFPVQPTAGSHVFAWQWASVGAAATSTMRNSSNFIPAVTYREDPRQFASNT